MKAFAIDRYKSTDGGRIVDLAQPDVGDNDVLVQIHAAGVNLVDAKISAGEFKLFLPYSFPLVLGNDVAGVVVKVGPRVRRFKPGDEVYARPDKDRIGTFAEFIAMSEDDVAIKPKELTMEEAASIPLVGLTAWQALVEKANLKPGEKVFIQAGTGGVGTFAIQLAKHLGAAVATTASAANFDLLKDLGADVLIDYKTEDFATRLHDYDVVLHSQDAKTLDKSLRVLKPGGKLISISGPPDPAFAEEIGVPWFVKLIMHVLSFGARRKAKRLNVTFSFLFMRANGNQLGRITSLIDQGVIRPVVEKVFPFESTTDALAYVEKGRAKGKVVVKVK
jgi:NADPH:quinone reductase-like Zn-dependent oxidoreductase